MNDLLDFIMNPAQGPEQGIQADVHAKDIRPHDMALLPDLGWVRVVNNQFWTDPQGDHRVMLSVVDLEGADYTLTGWHDDVVRVARHGSFLD